MMRKFVIFSCIVLSVSPTFLLAQEKLQVGMKAGTGVTFFNTYYCDFPERDLKIILQEIVGEEESVILDYYDRSLTFAFGGYLTYHMKPWFSIRGGLEYVPKGQKYVSETYLSTNLNMESIILKHTTIFKLNYVEFPVSVQFSTKSKSKPRNVSLFLNMGISPAVNIARKLDMSTSLVEQSFNNSGVVSKVLEKQNETLNLKDEISSTDIGILGSLGLEFNSFAIEFKITKGLTNILEIPDQGQIRNFAANVSLGFIF